MENTIESSETGSMFFDLYKYKGKNSEASQQERRDKFLQEQKEKRHQITDKNREQFELFIKEPSNNEDEQMDFENTHFKHKSFAFSLMQSEWFTEIPEDLEDNWLVKFGPDGFRIMLVARNRHTTCYTNRGYIVSKLKSNFPGGGGSDKSNGTTILDCIYNKKTRTIFILDCLCWNNMSMISSEAKFRFFWLNTKFIDQPELKKCLKYRFILLNALPAQRPLIQDEMFRVYEVENDKFYYDGVVFYHQESHYIFGYTPLVGWLSSYMLPEMLHIDVSPENMVKKPEDYQGIENYLQKLNSKTKKNKNRICKEETEANMDISQNLT